MPFPEKQGGARLLFERYEEEDRNLETAQPVRQPDTDYVRSFRWMQK